MEDVLLLAVQQALAVKPDVDPDAGRRPGAGGGHKRRREYRIRTAVGRIVARHGLGELSDLATLHDQLPWPSGVGVGVAVGRCCHSDQYCQKISRIQTETWLQRQ